MLKKNYKNSECAFAEQVVLYLYDEIDAGEKAIFDAHLLNCADCSDELSGLNLAHFSILEWKTAEFSPLASPKIEIPFDTGRKPPEAIAVSEKAQPWFLELGKIFKQSSAWVGAFAILIIFSGLFLFVFNFAKNDETASGENEILPSANVSLVSENDSEIADSKNRKVTENIVSDTGSAMSIRQDNKEIAATDSSQMAAKEKVAKSPNKSSKLFPKTKVSAQNIRNVASARKIYNSSFAAKTPVRGVKVPKLTLTAEGDDEEITLRLTDLFDEVGGK